MKKLLIIVAFCSISISGFSIGRPHNTFSTHKAMANRSKAAKMNLPAIPVAPKKIEVSPDVNDDDNTQKSGSFVEKLSLLQRAIRYVLSLSAH